MRRSTIETTRARRRSASRHSRRGASGAKSLPKGGRPGAGKSRPLWNTAALGTWVTWAASQAPKYV